MTRFQLISIASAVALTCGLSPIGVHAQNVTEPPAPARGSVQTPSNPRPTAIPLQVQVVISRYQGEKKVSSVPYTIAVNAGLPGQPARMRMGVQIAVPQNVFAPNPGPDGKSPSPLSSFTYRDVGTNIDVRATPSDEGRFELVITIEDSSVYTDQADGQAARVPNVPVIRTFTSTSALLLRDNQTSQFTAATDKINGEVVRVDVTLRVVK